MVTHAPARERIDSMTASAYTIPTDAPESDGTYEWHDTTMVLVEVRAGETQGLGFTYAEAAVARLVNDKLAPVVAGGDPCDIAGAWHAMSAAMRNSGRPGAGMMAISAVDLALWDTKARLFGVSVASLLNAARDAVPIYGSGGFTSYSLERIGQQLGGWVAQGIPRVKIKVGRVPRDDPARLDVARDAIGDGAELFVDANGAFGRKQALHWADAYRDGWAVSWFEEPVSSDDVDGLRLVREHGPAGLDIAAGEYGFLARDFREWLSNGAVDCLQADVTRCGGITGTTRVLGLADAFETDVSAHCAPALSAFAFCAGEHVRHLEYFHDHVRIERMLLDGALEPENGMLRPDRSRPGFGLDFKHADAEQYRVA